jgi:hypothetical protein
MATGTPQVSDVFREQFTADIYTLLEKTYAGFPDTVTRDTVMGGSSKDYDLEQQGGAVTGKSRNADIPIDHPEYGKVTLTVNDVYYARLLDDADIQKTNIPLYESHVRGFAGAFLRERDRMIGEGLKTRASTAAGPDPISEPAGNQVLGWDDDANDILNLDLFNGLAQFAEDEYWPRDQRYMPLTPYLWYNEFMTLQEVKNADYVPEAQLPFGEGKWMPTKMFMGFYLWALHGLPTTSIDATGEKAHLPVYHRDAIIYGVQKEFGMTTAWENLKQAHSFAARETHGMVVKDNAGLVVVDKYQKKGNAIVTAAT